MRTEQKRVYLKVGGKWQLDNATSNHSIIYSDLVTYFSSHYISKCRWIKRFTRTNLNDGFVRYTIYQNNGVKVEIEVLYR